MWRRLRGDEGMTLTELLVAMAVLGIVLLILIGLLERTQAGLAQAAARGEGDQRAQLALNQLALEIRSGGVEIDPVAENDPIHDISPGMSLRVYTRADAGTEGDRCIQWRITSGEELQRRDWSVHGSRASSWRTLAEHVVNRTLSPQRPAFAFASSAAATPYVAGNRALNIELVLSGNGSSGDAVEFQESVTGRNAQFESPNNACTAIPPY
jgi:prepilin-type N-terminal cleavage/methylation domain-containing protein